MKDSIFWWFFSVITAVATLGVEFGVPYAISGFVVFWAIKNSVRCGYHEGRVAYEYETDNDIANDAKEHAGGKT